LAASGVKLFASACFQPRMPEHAVAAAGDGDAHAAVGLRHEHADQREARRRLRNLM
jgi:hypothetical protein